MPDHGERIAVLERRADDSEDQMSEMNQKLDKLLAFHNRLDGGVKLLFIMGGIATVLASFIAWAIGLFKGIKIGG